MPESNVNNLTSTAEPKRDEAKVERARGSLKGALDAAKRSDTANAQSNLEAAWKQFDSAYTGGAQLEDTRKFLNAVAQVFGQATDASPAMVESLTMETVKTSLHGVNNAMAKRDGASAFTKARQSWLLLQQAFPTGIPQDRLNNFFAAMKDIMADKAPQMMRIFEDIMLLRQGYTVDGQKSRTLQQSKAIEMLASLVARTLRYAFEEKAKPGERIETRAMAAGAGQLPVAQWEGEELKAVQTLEWRTRYDSVLKRLENIAMGR